MSSSENNRDTVRLSAGVKEVLASSLSTLGRFHNDEYVLNRHCLESVKDIIRFLRRDNESYEIRRYLGRAKVVQNDLIHIIKACPADCEDLFDLTVRLLTVLTSSVSVLYGEEIPEEKIGRSIYMNLIEHLQEYKEAFYDIDFWNVICGKLTDLFEIDWSERSESQCLQIEKMLVLLRNVLHIPADPEREKITENDISVHDKILWSLRQSQILEFLLYVSSNKSEQRYYLHLLEIFTLILREQNPKLLAGSEVQRSNLEREKDMKELLALREKEKVHKNKYRHTRTFDSTFVLEGIKSFSGRDMIYHGSLEDMKVSVVQKDKKRGKPRNHKMPVQSDLIERRSSFSVRIFLKEFCIEFLNCSYNNLMSVAKEKLVSGKGLPNDETFYFWALKFFLEFNCAYNLDIKLISDSVNMQTFHYLQTNMEENFELLISEKKKKALWVRKLHLILKAYYSLLQTLRWMDSSKDGSVREMSNVLKSQVFYVAEYRDIALFFLTRYDSDLFSIAYLRDLIEATHLSVKLLEEYTKRNKIVVRKKIRKKTKRRKKMQKQASSEPVYESNEEIWSRIRDGVYKVLAEEMDFPDVAPFDVLMELTDEEQKERTMKNVQKLLHQEKIVDSIGLLRSARKVWRENDHFGSEGMSIEEEVMALKEICLAELGNERIPMNNVSEEASGGENEEGDGEEGDEESGYSDDELGDSHMVSEESFDMMSYKRRLVNRKVVEACAVLLKNYAKNSEFTNHCIIKLMFRIGWECSMPAMMYQASLFWTLLTIMNDKYKNYKEINDFTIHLVRKFREHAEKRKFTILELLFWKEPQVALEIQGDDTQVYESHENPKKGRKAASWSVEEEDELERLWNECDSMLSSKRKVEWIKSNLIDSSKSILAIRRKLKELGLIADLGSARQNAGKEWIEEEVEELTKYFKEFRDAVDIVSLIYDRLTLKRTKKSIRQKLLELGLVKSLAQLKKKKDRKLGGENEVESESSDDSEAEIIHEYSLDERKAALEKVQHLKPALEWLKEMFEEIVEEEDEDFGSYPLLAVDKHQTDALEAPEFTDLLRKLNLLEPRPGRMYWEIPKRNKASHELVIKLISSAIAGELSANDSEESGDEFEKLRKMMNRNRPGVTDRQKKSVQNPKHHKSSTKPRKSQVALDRSGDEQKKSELDFWVPNSNGGESDSESTKLSGNGLDKELNQESQPIRSLTKNVARKRLKAVNSDVTSENDNSQNSSLMGIPKSSEKSVDSSDDEDSCRPIRRARLIHSDSDSEISGSMTRAANDEFDKRQESPSPAKNKSCKGSEDEIKIVRNRSESSTDDGEAVVDDGGEQSSACKMEKRRRRVISSDSDENEDSVDSSERTCRAKEKTAKRIRILDSDSDFEFGDVSSEIG